MMSQLSQSQLGGPLGYIFKCCPDTSASLQRTGPLNIGHRLHVNASVTTNFYVHSQGDEFWLWMLLFPVPMATETIVKPAKLLGRKDQKTSISIKEQLI